MACPLMAPPRQRGQAMVEYVIILPTLLLIILGAIQLALIFQAKATLNYAAFLAARQGALHNGNNCVNVGCSGGGMYVGLAAGMLPLGTARYGAAFNRTLIHTGVAGVDMKLQTEALAALFQAKLHIRIDTLNPAMAWASAAGVKVKDPYTGIMGVPNDNLMYRSTALKGSGSDAMNLQDGNLLKIKVMYCFKLDVPFANQIIYAINNLVPQSEMPGSPLPTGWAAIAAPVPTQRDCLLLNAIPAGTEMSGKYLPIVATAIVRMQTPYISP